MKPMVAAFLLLVATALQADEDRRTFMFVAEPSAQGWQMLMSKPTDRLDVVKEAFGELGGEILSYYYGLGKGKSYITVALPDDNEVIQAVYLMRMPTGLLESYEIIELISNTEMVRAMKKSNQFMQLEKDIANQKRQGS
jgi:uncharacterized protein with GYD domain